MLYTWSLTDFFLTNPPASPHLRYSVHIYAILPDTILTNNFFPHFFCPYSRSYPSFCRSSPFTQINSVDVQMW